MRTGLGRFSCFWGLNKGFFQYMLEFRLMASIYGQRLHSQFVLLELRTRWPYMQVMDPYAK